ncbi:MAG: hypothetical protein ABIX28_00255 [Vicinamibacterales bacterium]
MLAITQLWRPDEPAVAPVSFCETCIQIRMGFTALWAMTWSRYSHAPRG